MGLGGHPSKAHGQKCTDRDYPLGNRRLRHCGSFSADIVPREDTIADSRLRGNHRNGRALAEQVLTPVREANPIPLAWPTSNCGSRRLGAACELTPTGVRERDRDRRSESRRGSALRLGSKSIPIPRVERRLYAVIWRGELAATTIVSQAHRKASYDGQRTTDCLQLFYFL